MQIKLAPDVSLFAVIVIFILNYLVVRKFFIRPISRVIEERETESRTAEQMYEEAMNRFNEATSQMESQLHVAKREAGSVRERYRAEAATHRNGVLERTHGESRKIVSEADAKLASDVAAARDRITRESESLARLAAEKILGRAV